jgi:Protein of unknown function (DUF3048) N-terminal domain/Protein of unknown function (DUF3048) C-terminal domain
MPYRRRALLTLLVALVVGCDAAPTPAPIQATATPTSVPTILVTPSPQPSPTPLPTTSGLVPADLDGVLTTPELAHRLPLVVSIDDSRIARPQSGFNAASIVWQAPADGYESRYLFMYQEQDAPDIGPVRSARIYLAHWAAELDAAFAHYGGDRLTRAWMVEHRGDLFTDLDGIGAGNPAYHRIHSRNAPHNAYTTSKDLTRVAIRLGADPLISARVHLRPFRDDLAVELQGTEQKFSIPYNTVTVTYRWEPKSGAYQRYVNGKAQVDAADGERVKARTVVVLFMAFRTDSTIERGHSRPVLGFIGSGVAWIYSEGLLVKGRWSKPHANDPTIILGPSGEELPFVRGRIFMQVVPLKTPVGS